MSSDRVKLRAMRVVAVRKNGAKRASDLVATDAADRYAILPIDWEDS